MRANYSPVGNAFQACYVDIRSGSVLSNGRQYITPSGSRAYAIDWAFLTTGKDPRVIISYPH